MYGGSGKLGRGGGGGRGGPGKRNLHSAFHPPPVNRPSATPVNRLSVGGADGSRNRSATPSLTSFAPSTTQETFSLVTGNPLNFAMIIRLTPDLVEEIKRLEAQGSAARIKFGANANNPAGNVVDVGGKDFRFTWSREMGDLCDIYEEQRSGEDGNGLLVESGCAWRKLNMQRILDESTKNHVKLRSEEAERKLKQRRAIVLDQGNPSINSQVKALAAVEANSWRTPFKSKKEPPFKKRKAEPPVSGPAKSVYKPGVSFMTPSKARPSASPQPSPPEQSGAAASPFGSGNLTKGHTIIEDIPIQAISKDNIAFSEKEMPSRVIFGAVRDKPGHKGSLGGKPIDLRAMLISLLTENPLGMRLKALEKAIEETIPNSAKKIEPILKQIATFQAPGRYILKTGVEMENLKKPSSECGSSPDDNHHQTPALEDNCDKLPASELNFDEKARTQELEEQAQLKSKAGEELNSLEKIEALHHSLDLFGEKKGSDHSEGLSGSSADSGSDSDSESDSSDGGSETGSRSRSRSHGGSASGSSSDSESDASSNSKEASDEDVDIISDDVKEPNHVLQASEPGFSTLSIPWKTSEDGPVYNGIDEKRDDRGSDDIEIVKELPDNDPETEMAVIDSSAAEESKGPVELVKPSLICHHEHRDSQIYTRNLLGERDVMSKYGFKHEYSDCPEKVSNRKSTTVSDAKHFEESPERHKRLKVENSAKLQLSHGRNSLSLESPHNLSPERRGEGPYRGSSIQTWNRTCRDGTDFGLQKSYSQSFPGRTTSDFQQLGRRSVDLSSWPKAPYIADGPSRNVESLGCNSKYSERSLHGHEGVSMQKDKVNIEEQDEDAHANEKKVLKFSKECDVGDKQSMPFESHIKKNGELVEKFREAGPVSGLHTRYPLKDNNRSDADVSPVMNGRGSILRRELSDLELGELREPMPKESLVPKKQFERKNSFKQLENKSSTSDYWNLDSNKTKTVGQTTIGSGKQSPIHSSIGIPGNLEGSSKKRTPEHNAEDFAKPHHRVVQSQQHRLSTVNHAEVATQLNKLVDASGKSRHNESGRSQGIGLEGFGDTQRKVLTNAQQQHEIKQAQVPYFTKESKKQKANTLSDLSDRRKATSLTESNHGGRKRREFSSDENSCSYSKYEKEEPDIKCPIKDFSQYKEYVQEYREKYESYCSLNKILESYRSEFQKLGRDLEIAKGVDIDRYYDILRQLKESYHHCGVRHKRLKKIFVVLHEELKQLKQTIKDYVISYTRD